MWNRRNMVHVIACKQAVPHARRRAGFTLIEAALVTVIVGVGVLAIVAAQQAYHQKNAWAQRMGRALLLANEIRELTLNMPQNDPVTGEKYWGPEPHEPTARQYDDLDDFDGTDGNGAVFNPPISAMARELEMPGWSQKVTVENVFIDNIGMTAPEGSTPMMRITVRVRYQGPNDAQPDEITRLTWVDAGR